VKLTTQIHFIPKIKNTGAILPITHRTTWHAKGQNDLLLVSFDSKMLPITANKTTVAKSLQGLVCFILGVHNNSCVCCDII
jgi:hypothetical protein